LKSYVIKTFGCQMNEHDSEVLAGMLEGMGYQPATDAGEADIILPAVYVKQPKTRCFPF